MGSGVNPLHSRAPASQGCTGRAKTGCRSPAFAFHQQARISHRCSRSSSDRGKRDEGSVSSSHWLEARSSFRLRLLETKHGWTTCVHRSVSEDTRGGTLRRIASRQPTGDKRPARRTQGARHAVSQQSETPLHPNSFPPCSVLLLSRKSERETGFEPATTGLEGRHSTS